MILSTHRAFRLTFACLFGLLLTFGLLMTLPAQAQEGLSVRFGKLVPLGRSCSDLVPGDQTPVCCAAGYVLVDGVPVAGAEVEISSAEGITVVNTFSSNEIMEPYYAASLSDTLSVEPGEWVTFTVRYDDFTVVRAHQAITGGQQVDLVINTFEDGDFEGTDLESDTIRLFHRPTVNVKANNDDDSEANVRVEPKLAVDSSGNLNLVWVDNRKNPELRQLYSSDSTNQGQSWSPNIQFSNFDRNLLRFEDLSNLVTDANGTLYVAWTDLNQSLDLELKSYLAKSIDGGLTWSTPIRIGNSDQNQSMFPTLAFDHDGHLIVAWVDYRNKKLDIYFAKSTDGGVTWSHSVKVNNDSRRMEFADFVYLTPSLVVGSDGTLMLAWTDNRNDHLDIYFARSEDGGQSWHQPNIRINDDGLNNQLTPVLAVGEENKLIAVWADSRDGHSKVYFANSSDGGLSWSDSDLVNPPSDMSTQHDPQVIISEAHIYVVWREHSNNKSNLLLARSSDEGQSWRLIGQVNEVDDKLNVYDGFPYAHPGLTVDSSGHLYFAWPDKRNHHTHEDIYTARWPDPNNFYSEGTYMSAVYDAREVVGWRTLEWGEQLR